MTISSTTRTAGPFTGTGTVSSFAFAFKVFSAGDIAVYRTQVSTGVVTTLVLNSDYTVALDPVAGGTVTLTGGNLASGTTLLIASSVANTQPVDITNQSGFYPAVINDALDRTTVQVQQLQQQSNRCMRYPDTEISISAVLPKAADRANQYLAFNSNGAIDIGGAVPDQRYYGSKTADPATRNDGSARQAGDLYFNSASNVMKVFNGSAWDTVTTTPVDGDKGDITISGGGATYTIDNGAVTSAKLDTNIAVSGTLSVGSTASVTSDMTVGGDLTVTGNDIKASGGTTAITMSGADVAIAGDLTVTGNDIKASGGTTSITLSGADVAVAGDLTVTGNDIKSSTATAMTLAGSVVTFAGEPVYAADPTADDGLARKEYVDSVARVGATNIIRMSSATAISDQTGGITFTIASSRFRCPAGQTWEGTRMDGTVEAYRTVTSSSDSGPAMATGAVYVFVRTA